MAVVFADNTIEIAVIQEMAGRPVVNVWHLHNDSEFWSDNPEAAVEDFRDNWQDHMTELQCEELSVLRFEWRSLDPGNGELGVVEVDSGKPTNGQFELDPAPPNVAALVKKSTSNRPRGRRDGRSFICGVPEGRIDERGTFQPVYQNEANAALQLFYDGISDSGLDWGGDSYPVVLETTAESRAPGTGSVTVNTRRVTSLSIDPLCSTQRERLR